MQSQLLTPTALECASLPFTRSLSLSLSIELETHLRASILKKGWIYRLARADVVRSNSDYCHREGGAIGSRWKLLLTIDVTFAVCKFLKNKCLLSSFAGPEREHRIDKSWAQGRSQRRQFLGYLSQLSVWNDKQLFQFVFFRSFSFSHDSLRDSNFTRVWYVATVVENWQTVMRYFFLDISFRTLFAEDTGRDRDGDKSASQQVKPFK